MSQAALGHGAVDHIASTFHQTALIGILNAEDKGTVSMAGYQPGVQSGTQVANVHIAGRGGSKTGTDFALRDTGFHLFKELHIQIHENTSM
jgi:hypothetical protein